MDERLRLVARLLEGEKMAPSVAPRLTSVAGRREVALCKRTPRA
jgi:hypothetical protein